MGSSSFLFSWREREKWIESLQQNVQTFDLVIIGGGITGCATARDAALRGLKVLLVDRGDIAHGTSSRSSRLVHGGVRYLENFDFRLVRESTYERAVLWNLSPHLVKPLGFMFPGYTDSRHSLDVLNLGLWLYDSLAMFRLPSLHRKLNPQKTLEEIPLLRTQNLTGSIFYWDAQTNDAKLSLANAVDAVVNGAWLLPKVAFVSNEKNQSQDNLKVLKLKDVQSHKQFNVQARTVVLAGGPWTDELAQSFIPDWKPIMAPTRGSHIVVSQTRLPLKHAVVHFHPIDGRVLFSIPWENHTIIGTTDHYDKDDPASVAIKTDEVDYLLQACAHDFPSANLVRQDVISTWCGIRPLVKEPGAKNESEISRDHFLEWYEPNLAIIAGGKLTTHREMARQTVELVINQSQTWKIPLCDYTPSTTRYRPLPNLDLETSQNDNSKKIGISEAAISENQLRHICQTQMPLKLLDIMLRRTDLFFKEPNNGWDLLSSMKTILCKEMDWDQKRWEQEHLDYARVINHNVRIPLERQAI